MVEALVEDAKAAEQSVIAYWKRLKPHYPDNETAPLWMACLAAFPVAIDIDLMYQLWANFRELKDLKGDTHQLPPLVVNDCILSPLFTVTGREIFEMEPDTRAFLLKVFKDRFGEAYIADLASFLYKYTREKRSTHLPEMFYDAQEWTAILAVDPKQAAVNILSSLKAKMDNKESLESIGISNLLTTFTKDNHELAEMMRQALDRKIEEPVTATEQTAVPTGKSLTIRPATTGNGITIEMPSRVSERLMPLYENALQQTFGGVDSFTSDGAVHAFVVAYKRSGTKDISRINSFIQDLQKQGLIDEENTDTLYNHDAEYNRVKTGLSDVLKNASSHDTVLFYFEGYAAYANGLYHLILSDTEITPDRNEDLSHVDVSFDSAEFNQLLSEQKYDRPSIVIILDVPKNGSSSWLPIYYQKQILLSAGEISLRQENVSKNFSLTGALITLFAGYNRNLTYKEIYRYLIETEKQISEIAISNEDWDKYFLTEIQQSTTLRYQQYLSAIGYNLFVDGKETDQYQKALDDFKTRFAIHDEAQIMSELQKASLLSDAKQVRICYLSLTRDESAVNRPSAYGEILKADVDNALKPLNTELNYFNLGYRDIHTRTSTFEQVIAHHVVLIGLNNELLSDKYCLENLGHVLNIAYALDRLVYFVMESNTSWRESRVSSYQILPRSLTPVKPGEGMPELVKNLAGVVEELKKYVALSSLTDNHPQVQQQIRNARISKKLDLSGLSLEGIPAAVFQLEGLIALDLSKNSIRSLPTEITQLRSLQHLNISDNPIEYLPKEIGNLLELESLDLKNTLVNYLDSDLGKLSRLKELHIENTRIKVLNFAAFPNGFPAVFTYDGASLINVEKSILSLNDHFKPSHTKEIAILEIHSEPAKPYYSHFIPQQERSQIHYSFASEIITLQELFRIIHTSAGTKYTIIYLSDEKNILFPQFGESGSQGGVVYDYFKAFGKPLNLIVNNNRMMDISGAFADLTGPTELNFVAIRNQQTVTRGSFPDKLFEMLWQTPDTKQVSAIYLAAGSNDDPFTNALQNDLPPRGYFIFGGKSFFRPKTPMAQQRMEDITKSDVVLLIVNQKTISGTDTTESSKSFIEEEYEIAVSKEKTILIFFEKQIAGTNIGTQSAFANELLKKHVIAEFSDQDDLKQKVFTALASIRLKTDPAKRMSLFNTLTYLRQLEAKSSGQLGYRLLANMQSLQDFSLPLTPSSTNKKVAASKAQNKTTVSKSERVSKKTLRELKPFNNKWVLVVGTGTVTKKSNEVNLCCEEVGKMLALEGYGLITGGWEGVDRLVGRAFEEEYRSRKLSAQSSYRQVLLRGQDPLSKEEQYEIVNRADWNNKALTNAFAVIIIGGSTLTKSTYELARKYPVPIIPVAGTAGVAEFAYTNLAKLRNYSYPSHLLSDLKRPIRSASDAESAANTIVTILQELIPKAPNASFKMRVERLYKQRELVEPDDLQKERWGAKSTNKGKRLQAKVSISKTPGLFNVSVTVSGKPLTGSVALFLHNSFAQEILYATAEKNVATFQFEAYEAFTLGAYTEDGDTSLELDLNEEDGYPKEFYYGHMETRFRNSVETLYKSKKVLVKDDLQKGRWGGKTEEAGMQISATVSETFFEDWFKISVQVRSLSKKPLNGEVAFFLHDSFSNEIRFTHAVNGIAKITVLAYEAFTIGAYTATGVSLELDLQKQKGYPKEFYYEEKAVRKKPGAKKKSSPRKK